MNRAVCSIFALVLCSPLQAQVPPRSVMTPKSRVDDPFVSFLHGIVYNDAVLNTDAAELSIAFPEFVPARPTPFNDIELLSRQSLDGRGRVTLRFSVPLRYEVPVDILGQRPVELQGSRAMVFDEERPYDSDTDLGDVVPAGLTDVVVLRLVSGYMRVDFAPWLDFFSGWILDDVDVRFIATVQHRGQWYALFGGRSPAGRPVTGVFEMVSSRFLLRPSRILTRFAGDLIED